MLTSLFSLFYITGEFHRFLHRGRAVFFQLNAFNTFLRPLTLKNDQDLFSLNNIYALVKETGDAKKKKIYCRTLKLTLTKAIS